MKRKILLIGWDAADWEICLPLIEAGKMPTLAKLMTEGTWGNLATINPALSPMLWTSIATGKRPFKHGIHGFTEVDPLSGNVRPITNRSRSCRAIWNMLQLHGLKSVVSGWWPSHPAEPIDGVMISDRFHVAPSSLESPWPVVPGSVHPPELAESFAELRIHPHHLDESHLLPFIPRAAEIDQAKDRRLDKLAEIIAACSTVHASATAAMQSCEWDFAAVYYDALDHVCHGFMKFHPPLKTGVNVREFEIYRHVVEAAYRYHDMMLETLLGLAGEDATVLLVSDHGFQSGSSRLDILPLEPAGPAAEHRRYGIFVAKGPGIRQGQQVHGAGILDICPTLLALFGLPVGADMDGKIIAPIWETVPELRTISSWEEIEGEDGSHPPGMSMAPEEAGEALRQLVALGYIEAPSQDAREAAEGTNREQEYNLALSFMDAGRYADAEPLLESLHARYPLEHRFGLHLAGCYHAIGREGKVALLSRKLVRTQLKRADQAGMELDRDALRHFLAFAAFSEKRYADALKGISRMSPSYRERSPVRTMYAEVKLRQREWTEAERAFIETAADDPENSGAWCGLARAYLGQRRFPQAAEAALASLSLVFERPLAHFLLGMALYRDGQIDRARLAFEETVRINSSHPAAYRMLSEIHLRHGGDVVKSSACQHLARRARQHLQEVREREIAPRKIASNPRVEARALTMDFVTESPADVPESEIITVVSGLPRSGTSMMMQMLAAGGLTPFTDHARAADRSNPQGYFEHEAVKSLHRDNAWMGQARGRVLKVVAPLLPSLAERDGEGKALHYRVIFMRRPHEQIVASRERMLGITEDGAGHHALRAQEALACESLRERQIPAIVVDYEEAMSSSFEVATRLCGFLGGGLACAPMAAAVVPKKAAPAGSVSLPLPGA